MNGDISNYFSKDDIRLRSIVDEDVDELVVIINEAYSYQDEAKGETRTNPEHLRKRIAEADFYTMTHDNKVIGCVYLEPKDSALHFGLLTLTPEYRGKGIAQKVMTAIDQYAISNNFTTIELDYMSLAPWLKNYYENYGFKETGQVVKWGKIDLIHMSKPVNA